MSGPWSLGRWDDDVVPKFVPTWLSCLSSSCLARPTPASLALRPHSIWKSCCKMLRQGRSCSSQGPTQDSNTEHEKGPLLAMDLSTQLLNALRSQNLPTPSQKWLAPLLTTHHPPRPPPPLNSLVVTARARLLAADLTTPGLLDAAYVAARCFPPAVLSNQVREARLGRDVVVQVLDIENLSRSRWDQVEELEAIDRGEETRGREVVRIRDVEDEAAEEQDGEAAAGAGATQAQGDTPGDGDAGARSTRQRQRERERELASKKATHKLVLQDVKGQKVSAIELRRVERIGVGQTNIGEKLLLKSASVFARGILLLDPDRIAVLGGRVESWHKAWTEGRLARLRAATGVDSRPAQQG